MDINTIGYLATLCIVIAFIPQTVKVWHTRSTGDVSIWTFSILSTGSVLFIFYAWANQDYPVLITNALTLIMQSSIVVCKLMYG